MRRILFFIIGGMPFLISACNNATETSTATSPPSTAAEKNKEAFGVVVDAFKSGDASKVDSVVASDFVDHTEKGDQGRDSLKSMITMMHTTMPDMKSDAVKVLADDEYVFGLMRYSGTSDGKMGMPAGPYDFKTLEVVRFKDGKAVEHWAYMEPSEMMKMMPPPPNANKKK